MWNTTTTLESGIENARIRCDDRSNQQMRSLQYLSMVLIIALLSCDKKSLQDDKEPIEISEFELTDELRTIKSGELTVIHNADTIQFGYNEEKNTDSSFDYSFTQTLKNDSILIYTKEKEICYLTDQREYPYKNQKIKVKRYRYDVATSFDEEADFYFIDNFGLIAIRGDEGNYLFFKKGVGFDEMIIKIFREDESGFFKKSIPPPIPSMDYDVEEVNSELDSTNDL